jgi:hypothetical protein
MHESILPSNPTIDPTIADGPQVLRKWQIEIDWRGNDRRLLDDVLADFGVTIEQTEDGSFLVSDQFEVLNDSVGVHALATKIANALKLASSDNQAVKFHVGSRVIERASNRPPSEHQVVKVAEIACLTMQASIPTVSIEPSASLSEFEKEQARQRQLEQEHRQRVERLSSRARAAFKNDMAAKVQRLLAFPELDTTTMNAIAELIQDDMGSARSDLGCENQFDRFGGSINHQKIFGDQARHATLKSEPHPKPMSPAEAMIFIRDVAERWFKYVAERE